MKFERKHAVVLLLVAVWNVLTYARFTKALVETQEDRPTGYYVAHSVLIVVNVLIAADRLPDRFAARAGRAALGIVPLTTRASIGGVQAAILSPRRNLPHELGVEPHVAL